MVESIIYDTVERCFTIKVEQRKRVLVPIVNIVLANYPCGSKRFFSSPFYFLSPITTDFHPEVGQDATLLQFFWDVSVIGRSK